MNIELKNIHYSERLSEETNAFTASLYINGVNAGAASNRGHGGPTDFYPATVEGGQLIREAEAYCKTLPPHVFGHDGTKHSIEMNLEMYVDDLLEKHLQQKELQKFQRKMDKAMQQGIVVGVPDQSFSVFKLAHPVNIYLATEQNRNVFKNLIGKNVLPKLKEGEKILNTNIPEELLMGAGAKADQYVKPQQANNVRNSPKKKPGNRI